uniref:Uncharacterized protein n=1 Tax=Anguilla anguilla TaxID=7936 RepID=A0A0E9QTJ9_ANGAN
MLSLCAHWLINCCLFALLLPSHIWDSWSPYWSPHQYENYLFTVDLPK